MKSDGRRGNPAAHFFSDKFKVKSWRYFAKTLLM